MRNICNSIPREYFLLVEYADGTFRIYSDDLSVLKAYIPKPDESVRLVSRRKPPCKEIN
jgi:hypothetical protein